MFSYLFLHFSMNHGLLSFGDIVVFAIVLLAMVLVKCNKSCS